ncbi:MAG: PH domain-containing protein [Fodinibius sp.]|nr:PH domain-containing protein [Fodinibius sp.]
MAWTDDKLAQSEEIIFSTRKHWSIFLAPLLLLPLIYINLWVLVLSLGILISTTYSYYSHQYVVTNERLIQKQGIYYIRLTEWPLHKIEDVIFTQSLGDSIWRKGTVVLMGMAIPKIRLGNISSPKALRNAIYSQLPTK